jgi:hypothetical protein
MKNRYFLFFLFPLSCLFIACEKEEPRVSIGPKILITNVDASSNLFVEFSAQFIDFGIQPILEYGFFYSDSDDLDFENADWVSKKGKPGKEFKLKATHSMLYGKQYNVAAFAMTADTVVFSPFVAFVSRGTVGFILDRIVGPSEIYFGDTLTFFGRNISKNPANFFISADGSTESKLTILDIKEDYFRAILPSMFSTYYIKENGFIRFSFDISGKNIQTEWPAKFREPIFNLIENQKVSIEGEVTILGDYLDSDIKMVRFADEPYFDVEVVAWEKTKIVFKAKRSKPNLYESISINVRRKKYDLENVYSYLVP